MPHILCSHNHRRDSCFTCRPASALGYLHRARFNGNKYATALKSLGSNPINVLGLSNYEEYKVYLETRFEEEYGKPLDWKRFQGRYSIEHIIPLYYGKDDDLYLEDLYHHTNTCVMKLRYNIARGNAGDDYDTWLACNRLGSIKLD